MMMLLKLFLTFFKIGAFTFGGGYAMLPLIQAEVIANGWLDTAEVVNFIAVSESTPGPFAINMATFVGVRMAGIPGALCATLGVVLPSFIIILIVARCFQKFKESRAIKGVMSGLRPAVVGLIASALVSIGRTVFFPDAFTFGAGFFISLVIFLLCAVLTFKKKLHPILLIVISAALGIAAGYIFKL